MKDFFQKISSGDHLKIQEAHIAALSQADIMDLRNVEVRAVKPTKRCVIRTPLALQIEEETVLDSGPSKTTRCFENYMKMTASGGPNCRLYLGVIGILSGSILHLYTADTRQQRILMFLFVFVLQR